MCKPASESLFAFLNSSPPLVIWSSADLLWTSLVEPPFVYVEGVAKLNDAVVFSHVVGVCASNDAKALPVLCEDDPSTCLLSPNIFRVRRNWAEVAPNACVKWWVPSKWLSLKVIIFNEYSLHIWPPRLWRHHPPFLASSQTISFSSGVGLMNRRIGALARGVSPTKPHCCAYIHQRPAQGGEACQPCSPPTGAWHLTANRATHLLLGHWV